MGENFDEEDDEAGIEKEANESQGWGSTHSLASRSGMGSVKGSVKSIKSGDALESIKGSQRQSQESWAREQPNIIEF